MRRRTSYRQICEKGRERLDQALWNGEYYVQKVDESQPKAARYQYGEGCLSDQLLGQWFAEVVGLGKLLPHDRIRSALASIFRYNFNTDFADFANAQRIYALNDEKGLLLCSWPKGKRPALPFVYSDEVWTGIEYQVAAHLIYEGMVKEGLAIVEAARARYDGTRRNPWNEIECGHHYARAMSSWCAAHGALRLRVLGARAGDSLPPASFGGAVSLPVLGGNRLGQLRAAGGEAEAGCGNHGRRRHARAGRWFACRFRARAPK